MPDVRMPDGAVVRFPDDMPPDQIRGRIAAKFPQVAQQQQGQGKAAPAPMPANMRPVAPPFPMPRPASRMMDQTGQSGVTFLEELRAA